MNFWDVLLDAIIDTAKLVPLLLVVYFLIELLEYKNVFKFEKSKLLKGNASPVIGAMFGSVPQCGFSVISSELYSEKKISIAALLAVFIATSDEAFPIMIANYKSIPSLIVLIITKFIMAILIGYIAMGTYKLIFKKNKTSALKIEKEEHNHSHEHEHENEEKHETESHDNHEHQEHIHACCHHDIKDNKFNWKHPLIHSAKITLYIFIVNIIFGVIIALVGEESLMGFLASSHYAQPIIALLIGLIPNCASSVVLTELYLMGGLSFGAIVAGLSVNAGLGLLILFKENKNLKENLFILFMLIIPSLIIGYALHFLPINLLIF